MHPKTLKHGILEQSDVFWVPRHKGISGNKNRILYHKLNIKKVKRRSVQTLDVLDAVSLC